MVEPSREARRSQARRPDNVPRLRRLTDLSGGIHAPVKGRSRISANSPSVTGFNPRPREGANGLIGPGVGRRGVSIHAPAKGRTKTAAFTLDASLFQSTPPRRGEAGNKVLALRHDVSIHAPAKGRRACRKWASTGACCNPRPREGAKHTTGKPVVVVLFQSTPPRRGEDDPCCRDRPKRRFNPRPREGAKSPCDCCPHLVGRFNPRPREGANRGPGGAKNRGAVSIHAPAKGRNTCGALKGREMMFQSTPPRRGEVWPPREEA